MGKPLSSQGHRSMCSADAHGSRCCPHAVQGPATSGAPGVLANGKPVLRVGDSGVHSACCGPNIWQATAGCNGVTVNGIPVVRLGDATRHCGGMGQMVEGWPNILVG